jgi:hypothetical protein
MITLIKDNFISKEICKKTINFYKKNKEKAEKFRDVFPLNLKKENLEENFIKNINNVSKAINNSVIDWMQIVYWPKNSFQDLHFDNASNETTLSSICYLNDNYQGGQTYFKDGTIFSPITGRILFFDGKYYLHGVKKIISGNRYVLAIWYKNG